PYRYQARAHDPDGVSLSFVLYSGPKGMVVDAATGLVSWSPMASSPASAPVILQVYDARGGRATQEFTLAGAGGNRAPAFGAGPAQVEGQEGQPLEIAVPATDADGDPLTYRVEGLPPGATFDPTEGLLSWTPGSQSAGTYEVRFVVGDGLNQVGRSVT